MNMQQIFDSMTKFSLKINFIIPLLTRITIAGVFIGAGWGKLNHLDKTIEYFTSLGMPAAHILAPFVSVVEFLAGLFILFGFATRFAAVPLIVIMIIAIRTAKWGDITGFSSLFEFSEYLYILLLLWLAFQGAGKISIDYIVKKKCRKTTKRITLCQD